MRALRSLPVPGSALWSGAAGAEDGLVLRLASDAGSAPVPIGADGTLEIARSQAAYDADASLIPNRKSGLFSAHHDTRSPGLPANVRRLGGRSEELVLHGQATCPPVGKPGWPDDAPIELKSGPL